MPKVNALSENAPSVYLNLVNSIKQEITKTQNELQTQKAVCYWKIGRHIARHLLNNQGKSGYKKRLYARLGHDLKIDERTLQQTVSFHRSFPIPTARSQLSWTHYRELLKIPDQHSRDTLFAKTKNDRVTTRELQSQIKHIKRPRPQSNVTLSRQKLRLRGIDTPEIATPKGKIAKTFVEEKLKKAKIITVKTYRKDKYDRYLADIFVGSREIFLNQKLLDEKLAVVY